MKPMPNTPQAPKGLRTAQIKTVYLVKNILSARIWQLAVGYWPLAFGPSDLSRWHNDFLPRMLRRAVAARRQVLTAKCQWLMANCQVLMAGSFPQQLQCVR